MRWLIAVMASLLAGNASAQASGAGLLLRMEQVAATAPYVIPGTSAPAPGGPTWPLCTISCPPAQGTSFATEEPTVFWDAIPRTIYTGDVPLCVIGAGLRTPATVAAGKLFGQAHFDVQVNNGPIKSTSQIVTCPKSHKPGMLLTMRAADLHYDGPFQARGVWYPVDGKPVVLQNPDTAASPCFADCSITLNGNAGATLLWRNSTVFVDPAGTDGSGCGTAIGASACRTPCGGLDQLARNSVTAGKGGDLSNTFVDFVNATYASLNCINSYNAATGWITFQPAPGSTVAGVIFTDGAANGPHVQNIWYNINWRPSSTTNGINNSWKTGTTGGQAVINGPFVGAGQHWNIIGPFQPGRWGRTFITDSDVSYTGYGCQGCYAIWNTHISHIGSDVLNNVENFATVYSDHVSAFYNSTGNTVAGSNIISGLTATADMQAGQTIVSTGTGCGVSTTIQSVDSSAQIHINAPAAGTCTATGLYTGAHPDNCQLQNTASHGVWFGYYTDGSLSNPGTVDAQGCPYVQGLPLVSANNFALYDVNSFIANNGRTNFQVNQTSDNWVIINSSWGGGVFNRTSGVLTNFQMTNATCEPTHPGGIGTAGGGIIYYSDPVANKCH